MNRELLAWLALLFVVTQAVGLFVAGTLVRDDVKATFITDNPDDVENSVGLIVYILFFTACLLIAIRFFAGRIRLLFRVIELLAVFGTSVIVFSAFFPEAALHFALLVLALKLAVPDSVALRNATAVIATAGAGSLVGVSLGILPVIVFIALLSVYDLIAVFGTKHMVVMAKAMTKENVSFTFALPTKEHTFELGTGDMVIPLAFASSVLAANTKFMAFPWTYAMPALLLLASLAGLLWTINFISKRVGMALPALPPQTALMLAVFFVGKAIGL